MQFASDDTATHDCAYPISEVLPICFRPPSTANWHRIRLESSRNPRTDSSAALCSSQPDASRRRNEPYGGEKRSWHDSLWGTVTTRRVTESGVRTDDGQAVGQRQLFLPVDLIVVNQSGIPLFPSAIEHPPRTTRTTFAVTTRRQELWDTSRKRTPARSRAELESSRARVPYIAGCELSSRTRLRTGALVNNPTRYPPAYVHSRSNDGHHSRTSATRSTTSCTGIREGGFRVAEASGYRRGHSRLHPFGHCPGLAPHSSPVPMHRVSSRHGRAAGGTRLPGSPRDNMTETAERHDLGAAIQSLRRRQQRHGLAAGRLVARPCRSRATARRRDNSSGARSRSRVDDRV